MAPDPIDRHLSRGISGRTILFVLIGAGLAVIGGLLQRDGWEPTWQRWGMISRSPCFSDLRVVTGAMDSLENGYDPMVSNPGSPWPLRMNYPRAWLWLFGALGIEERDSIVVGLVLILGFLAGLWWIARGIDRDAAIFFAVLFFSPATLLAIERGNIDLGMFFLLALAWLLSARSAVAATAAVLLAFMLKLFPLAGIVLLLGQPRQRALRLGAIAAAVVAIYVLTQLADMRKIWLITDKGVDVSYGYNVLWNFLQTRQPRWAQLVRGLSYFIVVGGIVVTWWRHRRPLPGGLPLVASGRTLDAYRVGAAVYAGTFLLGNNWDYRMIFLFFTLPQLFEWLHRGSASKRRLAISQLTALVVAMWAMALTQWLPGRYFAVRTAEELAKWWLYLSLLWQLVDTLPGWARDWLGFRFKPAGQLAAPAR